MRPPARRTGVIRPENGSTDVSRIQAVVACGWRRHRYPFLAAVVDEAPADDGGDVAPIEPSPPVFVGGGKLAIGGDIKPSIVKPASQLQAMAVERVDTLNDFLAVQGMEAIAEDMSGAEAVDVVFRGFSPLFRQEICDVADVTI